ncbi:hypothetical protein [Flavobacterium seoulense]|uniref:Uncharacterized protein n=1 Tax=Flavobacterium seoulense TaxID=1492738 RepID=A0A066WQI6_9FLAO|nr:hypothetical protein [Flavobacterium seoulense]KDN56317.1 hypothetical protein FEM21_05960 [Flavobacterium seoulense]
MKNFSKTPSLNLELNRFNIQNWKIEVVLKTIIFFLVLFSFQSSIAQATNSKDINELNSFLSKLKATSASEYKELDDLINKPNSIIYINENTMKTFGENYTALFFDIASLNYLKSNTIDSNNIEIVRINIKKSSDINTKIDLSIFSNYPKLKYIYIFSGINISEQNISNMIINNTEKYTLLYQIAEAE